MSFYHFPKCLKRRRQWEAALSRTDPVSGRLWRATEHSRLCSVHFISGHFCNSTLKVYKSCDIPTSSRCLCAFHVLEAYFMVMCLVLFTAGAFFHTPNMAAHKTVCLKFEPACKSSTQHVRSRCPCNGVWALLTTRTKTQHDK